MSQHVQKKSNAACDPCRSRKLKCTGDLPCSRCAEDNVHCGYSAQKPMGRPRKRRRSDSGIANHLLLDTTVQDGVPDHGADIAKDPVSHETPAWNAVDPTLEAVEVPNMTYLPSPEVQQLGSMPMSGPDSSPVSNTGPLGPAANDGDISAITNTPACACLSSIYLTLSKLQTMATFSFPFAAQPLRQGLRTASDALVCPHCEQQNLFLLASLLQTLVTRFRMVIDAIEEEASAIADSGVTKHFRMGDMSPAAQQLHGREQDCPAGFDVQLGAREWRSLAIKVIRSLVVSAEGAEQPSLLGLVDTLGARQRRFHADPEVAHKFARSMGAPDCRSFALKSPPGQEFCAQVVGNLRMMVDTLVSGALS